jgi:PAS domain S-box-containing protein
VADEHREEARLRAELEHARLFLEAIVDNFPDMFFVKEAVQLSFVELNRAGEKLLGVSREDLLGKTDFDLFPRVQAESFQAADREALASGRPVVIDEEPIETAQGRRWLQTKKVPIKAADGTPLFLLGISQDITDRFRAEEERREWATLFACAQWGIFVASADAPTFDRMNKAFADMHGYTVDELTGRPLADVFPPELHDELARAISIAHETGHHTFESVNLRKDGSAFPVLVDMTTVRDEHGEVRHRVANVQDITSVKRAENELRRAKELAEGTNAELEAFSYSVSHDLRAPLRAIDGFSQALLEDYQSALDDTGQDYLRRVRVGAQRMARLIDDLLGLARVSMGELAEEPVDLGAIARVVMAELVRQDSSRDVRVEVEEGLSVTGDPGLLRVALENLLGNAWKFTSKKPRASIVVGRTTMNGRSCFFVRDDGAGFDMAHTEKLFSAFHRLHPATEFEGTGIGLATVARVIRRHGGRVWAEGKVDQGATFYFQLP